MLVVFLKKSVDLNHKRRVFFSQKNQKSKKHYFLRENLEIFHVSYVKFRTNFVKIQKSTQKVYFIPSKTTIDQSKR
jgi:hypothetical protein